MEKITSTNSAVQNILDDLHETKKELKELKKAMDRLWEAEDLLKEITSTGSHHQIREKVDKFFGEE
jgi:endoglucanase Acf2